MIWWELLLWASVSLLAMPGFPCCCGGGCDCEFCAGSRCPRRFDVAISGWQNDGCAGCTTDDLNATFTIELTTPFRPGEVEDCTWGTNANPSTRPANTATYECPFLGPATCATDGGGDVILGIKSGGVAEVFIQRRAARNEYEENYIFSKTLPSSGGKYDCAVSNYSLDYDISFGSSFCSTAPIAYACDPSSVTVEITEVA